MTRPAVLTACAIATSLIVAGCATSQPGGGSLSSLFASNDRQEVVISEAQACAIGYDLAHAIHDTVSLRRTVIVAPTRSSSCERHALNYLRLAGFRIDQGATTNTRTAQNPAGVTLDIELTRFDGGFAQGKRSAAVPGGKRSAAVHADKNGGSVAGHSDTVSAVARLGRGLTIARSYRPAHTGVIAVGPISIQHLDPDTYARRPAVAGDRRGGGAS